MKADSTVRLTRNDLLSLPRAPEGLIYIAVVPYGWGSSPDAVKALANAKSNAGSGEATLHLVNEGAEVDSVDGTLRYNSKTPGIKVGFGKVKI